MNDRWMTGRDFETLKVYDYALMWIEANPEAWRMACDAATHYASEGRHFSMRFVMELVRMEAPVNDSTPYKVPNNCIPAFTRFMVNQHPECRPFVTLRRSRFDEFFEWEDGEDGEAEDEVRVEAVATS